MLLTLLAEKFYYAHKKKSCIFILVVSVILLALFAGLRSTNVGSDVSVYLINHFAAASRYNLFGFCFAYGKREYLYYALVWLVRRMTSNIHIFMFIHQAIIATIVYVVIYKNFVKNNGSLCLYVFMYLMMWYGTTFNIIRQSLGITLLLPAFYFMKERKWFKYYTLVLVATLFHTSLAIAVFFPLFIPISKRKNSFLYTIAIGISAIIAIYFLQEVFSLVNFTGIFDRYERFFDYRFTSRTNFNLRFFIIKLGFWAGINCFYFLCPKVYSDDVVLLNNFFIFDLIGYCASIVVRYGYRISYPFLAFQILLIPLIDKRIQSKKNRFTFRTFVVISMVVYFYFRYVRIGYDWIIPYELFVKDI